MMKTTRSGSRRSFIKKLGATLATIGAAPVIVSAKNSNEIRYLQMPEATGKSFTANDKLNIACIGAGGMGMGDTDTALRAGKDGVAVVAACDLYSGRLIRAKEKWGNDIFTTKRFQEIIDRKDVDIVICGTTDHWHEAVSVAALRSGKAVYCEKPMTKFVEEGHRIIKAQHETGKVFQVGSQYGSSIMFAKARELVKAGEIGTLNFCEAMMDRHSFRGAWQYSIPLDASEETVDWKAYTANTTQREFDPMRFFRWRNYQDYGTGIAGDLFVHMLTIFHTITGSKGPEKVYSSGGLRYFKDGREVPDIQVGVYDYPETEEHPPFNLVLRVNFADGSGGKFMIRLVGDEGEIIIQNNVMKLTRTPWPSRPRPKVNSFAKSQQEAYMAQYNEKYEEKFEVQNPKTIEYKLPESYPGDRYMHFCNFFDSIRDGKPLIEDAVFGLRAAGPTLAGNQSFAEKKAIGWDPIEMRITG